jgi:hypothetical protein
MGTQFKDGEKPKNNVTVSRGTTPARNINADTGKAADRSFAQPNPALPPREIEPKAHADVKDEAEALRENSTKGHKYTSEEDYSGSAED